ncbi:MULTISPECIES: oxalurate catabolism protein HpxX [unclassified Brenneria]|uniref:oxalurate catabolism protein HpxX n=1 Tax=unclassified Brenneria TaxID=2634434 RepID=UPI0015560C98|nr:MULTISPECIES: oxalurate catabolism protein HpxX [unclassified Brenneria]MBJ7223819.1 oxalurate catabolism protein HpxX [Brenneria sp. L3-3C-1]MEE3645064.1 oxalurate catabolism protein HpxX [Brenneria sp. L3_3C_1]MEE3652878.1 oxalurate catabolism protein HpxX [Brenneria sp. HEZEL_4_2_4]NPD02832.1 oxalurate catabolism protein HpxX [Brenneria sp. hezel4-2-4]
MSAKSTDNAVLTAYLQQMETLLALPLTDDRRQELLIQFSRIHAMAQPLMDFPLNERQEIAGVYQL